MPTYEYACTACGERTEARQGFQDPPLEVCPHCGGKLRKLYSPVGIVFKGTGFYSTDGRKSSADAKSSSEKSDKKSTSAKDAGASDKPSRSATGESKTTASDSST
jgi:putative FmdB family regulatory protein